MIILKLVSVWEFLVTHNIVDIVFFVYDTKSIGKFSFCNIFVSTTFLFSVLYFFYCSWVISVYWLINAFWFIALCNASSLLMYDLHLVSLSILVSLKKYLWSNAYLLVFMCLLRYNDATQDCTRPDLVIC